MLYRSLTLYLAGITSFFHRLRHDLGRELTVLIASVVLFATFFYVFNDFLNVQVLSLSPVMRERGAECATAILLLIAVLTAARLLRAEAFGEQTLRRLAIYLGEDQNVVRTYLLLRYTTTLLVLHGFAWWAVWRWLVRPRTWATIGLEALMLISTLVLARLAPSTTRDQREKTALTSRPLVGVPALVAWRWQQMLWRNRATQACLLASLPFLGLVGFSAWRGTPVFVSIVAAMIAGILAASSLAFQMAEDLPNAWTERGFGVSHADFVKAYEMLGFKLAAWIGFAAALLCAGAWYSHGSNPGPFVNDALKVMAVAAIPSLAAPGLLLQIDGRRPAVNILLILLAGLFLGTAVFAHWLGLVLIPILHYYALQSQAGRFYRA